MAESSVDVTLPASENELKAASSDTGLKTASLENREQQFAVNRVVSMPLVTPVYELAPATSMQDRCSITESTCKVAEKEAEPGTAAALTLAERGSQTALTMEGLDVSAAEHRTKGCFVRLGSLSTSLRNRAFMLILNKLRQTRQNTHENLAQLHQTINLIEHVQQEKKLRSNQETLRSMWGQWSQKQEGGLRSEPGGSKDSSSQASKSTDHNSPASSSQGSGSTQLEVESKTLAMSRSLTQQLQATYLNLLSNIRGLPTHLQEKMQQVHQNMAELHRYFSSANSFQDLPGNVLNQSREKVAKAWEALDEVTDFLLQNPPVTWLVESLVSLEGELLETEEKDILKVLKHYEPQDCKDD
ncbi:Perilipin-3 [Chelonia mydas]|uniref:Perilipin n=1 Tax=Chelonia mydas TaxID=8469 RepID=M7ANC1_CHEMY|nr:Perilipin-3 [Chelonia mydas]